MVRLESLAPSLKRRFQALFGSRVEVLWFTDSKPDPIEGDTVWVEDIVFDMAFRAKNAMPYGGRLVVEWANIRLDETADDLRLSPGAYVMVEISSIRLKPSESTSAESACSVIYPRDLRDCDLVRAEHMILSLGGQLCEYNEPGRALTLRAFFPSVAAEHAGMDVDVNDETVRTRILVVEDESYVRNVAFEILESEGYQVLTARTGKEAMAVFAEKGPVHLLLTDLIMPGMDGERLSLELRSMHPAMKTIYMSGYNDTWLARFNQEELQKAFLPKPFTLDMLTSKVREVLEKQA